MHIISRKKIHEFCKRHPEAAEAFDRWYRIVKNEEFRTLSDVKNLFPSADQVKNFVVFDIGGNKYRLTAYIRYQIKRLYIRHIMTHEEYNKGKWKEDEWFMNTKH